MGDGIKRLTCVKDSCGTFPMDAALYQKLKRTGNSFTCPAGHEQHFTESTESQLRERIADLEAEVGRQKERVERWHDKYHEMGDRLGEYRSRARHAEQVLLERTTGVIRFAEDEHKWACACGSHGRKDFETAESAREAWEEHRRRQGCGDAIPEDLIEVAE